MKMISIIPKESMKYLRLERLINFGLNSSFAVFIGYFSASGTYFVNYMMFWSMLKACSLLVSMLLSPRDKPKNMIVFFINLIGMYFLFVQINYTNSDSFDNSYLYEPEFSHAFQNALYWLIINALGFALFSLKSNHLTIKGKIGNFLNFSLGNFVIPLNNLLLWLLFTSLPGDSIDSFLKKWDDGEGIILLKAFWLLCLPIVVGHSISIVCGLYGAFLAHKQGYPLILKGGCWNALGSAFGIAYLFSVSNKSHLLDVRQISSAFLCYGWSLSHLVAFFYIFFYEENQNEVDGMTDFAFTSALF